MRAKEIRELVKIAEESNIGELEVTRWWGSKVRISKSIHPHAPGITAAATEVVVSPKAAALAAAGSADEKTSAEPAVQENLLEIRSPMVGTFYRAPAPDAEPYIREGDRISQGKVLCIIEAMKLMNEIEAEVSGRIARILVENAQPVEFNQPLFLVEPS
jgi:acetyl-CoA carboxylase biotin carboxyl carrier protein